MCAPFELLIFLLKCHALCPTLQSESKKKGSSSDDREESDEDPRKRKEVIESERALKIEVESLQVTFAVSSLCIYVSIGYVVTEKSTDIHTNAVSTHAYTYHLQTIVHVLILVGLTDAL